jgi:hypothetical protein
VLDTGAGAFADKLGDAAAMAMGDIALIAEQADAAAAVYDGGEFV